MSHWTRAKVEIKNMDAVRRAAEDLGLSIEEKEEGKALRFVSPHAGTVNAEMILSDSRGGQCAVIKQGEGFSTIIDNWNNSIVGVVGRDCNTLNQKYTERVVRDQVMQMGGIVSQANQMNDGSVELHVSL